MWKCTILRNNAYWMLRDDSETTFYFAHVLVGANDTAKLTFSDR
jgi:hypothetical protein